MRRGQVGERYGLAARQGQTVGAGDADRGRRHTLGCGSREEVGGRLRPHRQQVAALVLAEQVGVGRQVNRHVGERRAEAARHGHLGERDGEAPVREVMHRVDGARLDQAADEVAVAALQREVDGRRRALLAALDHRQVGRLAEPALARPDEHQHVALALEGDRRVARDVVEHADAADGRGRQDADAVGLVVERDVARHDREVERPAGLADALEAADELAHHLGLLGVAEVEVVGDGERLGADRRDVAPRLGHGLPAALDRVGLAVARGDVAGQRQALRPVLDPHDGGVAAGLLDGVAQDEVVILLEDPALRGEVGGADEALQRVGERGRRRDIGGRDHRLVGVGQMRPVVERGLVAQLLDRQVGHGLAVPLDDEAQRVCGPADHREIEAPLHEDRLGLGLHAGLEHHEHALLALREHHLVGRHALLAGRHFVDVELDAEVALGAHLHRRAGEAGRAHVLDGDDRAGGHQLQAGFQQQLLGEGVADLHGRALRLGFLVELGRRHGGAVDAVAAGLGAEIDDRVPDAGGGRVEDAVGAGEPHRHGVDQDVAVVALVEAGQAADGRHAEGVAVAADPRDDAGDEAAGARVVGGAEAQGVERRDRPRAHGEDVAQDAAHAGRRALVGLDVTRVVVALHLEDAGVTVTDVDDARVLARPLDHPRRRGRQPAQVLAGGFVGTVLVPHRRDDAELGQRRVAPDQAAEALVLVRRQAVLGHELGGDRNVVAEHGRSRRGRSGSPGRALDPMRDPNRAARGDGDGLVRSATALQYAGPAGRVWVPLTPPADGPENRRSPPRTCRRRPRACARRRRARCAAPRGRRASGGPSR